MWKHLSHPNIAPFLGATFDPLQLVSGWMPSRGLTQYVTVYPGENRLKLVGLSLVVSGEVLTLFVSYGMSPKA